MAYRDFGNGRYGTLIAGQEDAPGGPAIPEFSSVAVKLFSGLAGAMLVIYFGIYLKKKIIDPRMKGKRGEKKS